MKRSYVVNQYSDEAKLAVQKGDLDLAWKFLEKAHIISQPSALLHTKVHWIMLLLAIKSFNWKKVRGQIFRFFLASPGSLLGKYPDGNTGRSDVSAFQKMPIPSDLSELLIQMQ